MSARQTNTIPRPAPLAFHSPRNWTAFTSLFCLGLMHIGIARLVTSTSIWVNQSCLIIGGVFCTISVVRLLLHHEIAIDMRGQSIVVRWGIGTLAFERRIDFDAVQNVRISYLGVGSVRETTVSIICDNEEIELPASDSPRQQALSLATLFGVRLIKLYPDQTAPITSHRIAHLLHNDETGNNN